MTVFKRASMDPDERESGKELGGVQVEEIIIKI